MAVGVGWEEDEKDLDKMIGWKASFSGYAEAVK